MKREIDRLPCDVEEEKGILSAVMDRNDPTPMYEARALLKVSDFMLEAHRRLYALLCDLQDAGTPLGLSEVYHEISRLGMLETLGGLEWLTTNFYDYGTVYRISLASHLGRVRELSIRRRVISAAQILMTEAGDQSTPLPDAIATFEKHSREVSEAASAGAETISDIFDEIGGFQNFMLPTVGVQTPWHRFNELTAGLQPGDLVILGARPSMGKTAIMLEAARHNAMNGICPAVYSYEMSKQSLVKRLLSRETHIPFTSITNGQLTKSELGLMRQAGERLKHWPIHLVASAGKTPMWIRCHVEKLIRKENLRIGYVDYLQLVKASTRHQNRNLEVGSITKEFKSIAMECGVPMVVLAQLSRANEARTEKRPIMSDLRDSGEIENDADLIAFLHRPEYYERHRDELKGVAELIIAKQRNGATIPIDLTFKHEYGGFLNPERS